MVRYSAARSTNGTCGCFDGVLVGMDIITLAFYLHLESLRFDGTIHCFKHAYNILALGTAADRPLSGSHALQEMSALLFQGFHGLDAGTDNVAVADLESELSIIQGLRLDLPGTFLENPYLLDSV